MLDLSGIKVRIGADLSEVRRKMKELERLLEPIAAKMEQIGSKMTRSVTVPLGLLAGASLKAAADIGRLEQALVGIEGTTEGARRRMDELKEAAKLPGLGFEQAIKLDVRLRAVGISAEVSKRALLAFGNAVALAGGRADDLDGVALALSQIAAKGKISAEEINQLAERVPQVRKAMQEAFGTSDTEALGKQGVGAAQFIEAVVAELEKLPPVAGSLGNSMDNAAISVRMFLAELGSTIDQSLGVGKALDGLAVTLEKMGEGLKRLRENNPGLARTIVVIAGIAAAIGPLLIGLSAVLRIAPKIRGAFALLTTATGGFTAAILAAAAAAGFAAYDLRANWDRRVMQMKAVWIDFEKYIIASTMRIVRSVQTLGAVLTGLQAIMPGLGQSVLSVSNGAMSALNEQWQRLQREGDLLGLTLETLARLDKEWKDQVNAGGGSGGEGGTGGLMDSLSKKAEKIKEVFADLGKRLGIISGQFRLFGRDGVAAAEARIQALQSAIESLLGEGLAPTDRRVQSLMTQFREARVELDALTRSAEALARLESQVQFSMETGGLENLENQTFPAFDRSRLPTHAPTAIDPEKIKAFQEQIKGLAQITDRVVAGSLINLANVGADAFAGLITGAQSFAETMQRIGQGIQRVIQDLIASLIKAAIRAAILSAIFPGLGSFSTIFKSGLVGGLSLPAAPAGAGVSASLQTAASAPSAGGFSSATNAPLHLKLVGTTLSSGDIAFSMREGRRQLQRIGTREF